MDRASLAVSVIIPVYFDEVSIHTIQYFRRALDSIFDQSFPDAYEILIVDHSLQLASRFANAFGGKISQKVRWIRSHPRGGFVHALNTGLCQARYPLVARLNAEDRWCSGKIEQQLSLLANDPDLSIVATGTKFINQSEDVIVSFVGPGDWNGILRYFVEQGYRFPHGSVVARKDIFKLLGGYPHDPQISHCEDFTLWGTWLRFFKPAVLEKAFYESAVSPEGRSKDQLARVSALVQGKFIQLDSVCQVPSALSELATALKISILQAGVLAYRMWHYRVPVRLPKSAVPALCSILFDKDVYFLDGGSHDGIELAEALRGFECSKNGISTPMTQQKPVLGSSSGAGLMLPLDNGVVRVN
jgi:glycosyltransferase involved in cell wall biosynthesis